MAAGPARPIAPPDYALQQVAFHLGFKGTFYNYVDQILPIIHQLPPPYDIREEITLFVYSIWFIYLSAGFLKTSTMIFQVSKLAWCVHIIFP